jgi:hypothetical protein
MGVFAGFGAGQAKGGPEYVEGGVGFQVKQDEQQLLFRAGRHAFAPTAGPALVRLLHRKARIRFGLAARRERLGQGAKVAKSNPFSARICRSLTIVFTSSIPKNTVWEQA